VSLRDARIRTKLAVVLLIPVISTVGLAGVRLLDSSQRAADARLSASLNTLSAQVTALSFALHHERMAVAEFLADGHRDDARLREQLTETDARVAAYKSAEEKLDDPPQGLTATIQRIGKHLDGLGAIREEAQAGKNSSPAQMVLRYGVILADLDSYVVSSAQYVGATSAVADRSRAVAAFAATQSAAAEQQAIAYIALSQGGEVNAEQRSAFLATLTTQQEALEEFLRNASAQQRVTVRNLVSGDAVALADSATAAVTRSGGNAVRVSADEASRAIGAVVDLMRYAQQRLERQLAEEIGALSTTVTKQAIAESIALFALLLLAIVLASFVARMMVRSLERLRGGALSVAHRSLPSTVERLRDARGLDERSADQLAGEVRDEIRVTGRDEIGQVAQAFHVVHREAVRIAAEQAVLRATVSSMFLSLARRSQTLVDRMIAELDSIEQHEQDPKRLARMFRLDHLATRMRRNDENLLVLAGADASPTRRDDAGLEDALRAAQSEVELYDRIEFSTVDGDTAIAAHAVNDVVRMVAELMDNGTRFSPPGTVVVADARRVGDYVLIQVEDRGLGMTDEQIHVVNERLATPGVVDVSAFRMMGLGVVGRLAHRYGIKAELRRNVDSGITAALVLPRAILMLPRAEASVRPRHHLALEEGRHQALAAPAAPQAERESSLPTRVPGQQISGEPVSAPPISVSAVPTSGVAAVASAAEDTTELPIFHQMQTTWFGAESTAGTAPSVGSPQGTGPESRQAPGWRQTGGAPDRAAVGRVTGRASVKQDTARSDWPSAGAPPMARAPVRADGSDHPEGDASGEPSGAIPRQRTAPPGEDWRTSADVGWRAAAAVATPVANGPTTRSGLPIRKPQANLVPGSVGEPAVPRVKRTPEQVQGLLSAYTRGVQRGRDDLTGQSQPGITHSNVQHTSSQYTSAQDNEEYR
jgi:signal transduction histidine kinase